MAAIPASARANAAHERRRLRRLLRRSALAVAAVLALLTLLAAYAGYDALGAVREAQAAQTDLSGALHGGSLLNLTRAQIEVDGRHLADASTRLHRDRVLLRPGLLLLRGAGWLPGVGTPLAESGRLLDLAADVAAGGASLTHGVDPLLAEVDASAAAPAASPAPPAQRLLQALDAGAPSLDAGDASLNDAARLRRDLHPQQYRGPFGSLRDRVAALDADLPRAVQTADALALLPGAVRTLFGFDGHRTYVVLGQDSAELRATGGFIGSAGLLTFDRGRLSYQEYRSSYDFMGVAPAPLLAPPAPMAQYAGDCCWFLMDANWSPDFPTTARTVLDFVQRTTGVRADGVIAFDNDAVTDLLAVLGPLAVPGFPRPVTAQNWYDLATQTLYTGPDALAQQESGNLQAAKTVGLGALLAPVLARMQTLRGDELKALVDQLRAAGAGNHLFVAPVDQGPAAWAHMVGADGALFPPPAGDIVAPVETNLGFSKVGPYIQRSGSYEVWLAPDGTPQRATLTLTFRNAVDAETLAAPSKRILGSRWLPDRQGYADDPGFDGDYLRIYLPAGSHPSGAAGLDGFTSGEEGGLYQVAGWAPVEAGQQAQVSVRYQPGYAGVPAGEYALTLFKQGGVTSMPWQVTVHLAPGTRASGVPAGATVSGDTIRYSATISGTTRLQIQLVK